MIRWIIKLLLNGAALLCISSVLESVQVRDFSVAVLAAFILGLVNTLVRPILMFLTLPLRFITLGLFRFVVNAATFALTAYLIDGFELGPWPDAAGTAIVAAALMSLISWVIELIVGKKKE
jgi:putative membrane protein